MLSAPEMYAQFSAPLVLSAGAGYEVGPASCYPAIPFPISIICDRGILRGRIGGPTAHIGLSSSGTFGLRVGLDMAVSRTTQGFSGTLAKWEVLREDSILPVKQQLDMNIRFAMTEARLELLGTYRSPFGIVLALGPYVGYRSVHEFEMIDTLVEPKGARFSSTAGMLAIRDSGRARLVDDGRYQQLHRLSAGALLALSYSIPLADGIAIAPELHTRFDILSPFAAAWKMLGIGGGLSLCYTLSGRAPVAPRSPAMIEAPMTDFPLSSAIAIHAVGPDGARLPEAVIRRTVADLTRHVLLAPALRFDDTPGLPARYIWLTSAEAELFDPDSVARLDPGLIERNVPNIVGARLRGNAASIRLVASVLPGERAEVALLRASSLRRYLGETWGIGDDRMTITTEPGEAPTVRVAMEKALDLSANWSEPRVETSPVRIEPEVESRSGVKSWSIGLLRDGRELARQSDGDPASRINIGMLLSELRGDGSRSPLVAELAVEDSSGARSIARDTLAFRFEESGPPGEITEYLLLGAAASEELVGVIAAAARVGSHVTITPLSDRSAAREAASNLASRLGGSGIDVRLASPPGDGEKVEGMKIEIEEEAVAHP
jgi:hypothetical protein